MEPLEGKMAGTPNLESVSTRLQRIAQLAQEDRSRSLVSLAHHIDRDLLRRAYGRTRKDGAPGVDGQTAAAYEENLEENLQSLLDRFKSGVYKAPPVRRVYIPKGDDPTKKRPIGVPTFEDKVLQRAVAMVLEAVYEQDFLDCSYGCRPGRSAHHAIRDLRKGLMAMGGGWVLEADIQSYYDNLDHGHLRSFLDQRVRDGVIRRAIDKWLKAGVMEEGNLRHPATGTPQGGVISPLLSNIYLHEVLDVWFETAVKPRLAGGSFPDPLRGRLRSGIPTGERCATGAGGAAEAIRSVRPSPPPGQDSPGTVRAAPLSGGTAARRTGKLRLSRFHPLLGEIAPG